MGNAKIYKVINTINNQIYIGSTIHPLDKRFYEHLHRCIKSDADTKLCNSIREFGAANFTIELLEECKISEVNDRERYYIELLDTLENGLNTILGSDETLNYIHSNEVSKSYGAKIENLINSLNEKPKQVIKEPIVEKQKKVSKQSVNFLKELKEKLKTINKQDPNLNLTVFYDLKGNKKWKDK